MHVRITSAIVLSLLLVRPVLADDPIQQAKQLYDAAEYDGVLSLVRGLEGGGPTGLSVEMREYRALSLLALGRTSEAEQEVAVLLDGDPLYAAAVNAPPRWKTTVDRVRARVRPGIIRTRYNVAKQHYDAQDFAKAATGFDTLKSLLAGAQKDGEQGLGDLVTLTDGFLQLSRAALAPPAPEPAPTPVVAPSAAPPAAPAVAAQAPVMKAPVTIERPFPRWDPPGNVDLSQRYEGRIAVMVAADGSVKSARVVDSIHPSYDGVLTSAAKRWRFEPATRNGEPVPYEVEIPVVLTPASTPRR